ncbi:hypothetical protein Arub01_43960 [Actinomadura rubrobrunea]|uniref:Uncharacterized protein n=1 Tax=Actinomadura rubrobrunea TaxID=115335 RepID=A0A9W6UYE3_9ACTN|nr:hypothetical protein Arub01_43960 [Actinomadura rubrobrunea]
MLPRVAWGREGAVTGREQFCRHEAGSCVTGVRRAEWRAGDVLLVLPAMVVLGRVRGSVRLGLSRGGRAVRMGERT